MAGAMKLAAVAQKTVFLPKEKARPSLGKEGCLAIAKVLAGLQNEELEAALSSKFKPVEAPKSAELRKALRSALKKSPMVPHVGIRKQGNWCVYGQQYSHRSLKLHFPYLFRLQHNLIGVS